MRAGCRRFRAHAGRCASVQQSPGAGAPAVDARAARAAPVEAQPAGEVGVRLSLRGRGDRGLPPASGDQGAGGGVTIGREANPAFAVGSRRQDWHPRLRTPTL